MLHPAFTARFNDMELAIIDHAGQHWVTAQQLGTALGFSAENARHGVLKLYRKHADEFSHKDKGVVELATPGGVQRVTIFSSNGCHLLSFFANTPRAKEFRAWAKQVLSEQAAKSPAQPPKRPCGRALVTRAVERLVLELFVSGLGASQIARQIGVSRPVVSQLINAKYQFSAAAGEPECSPELLAAVAERHLALEQEGLINYQQRMAQRLRHNSNNQALAEQLDRVGQHLQQPLPQALLPMNPEGDDQ
uniref:Bro-N domain-containing protein n=1 Tax=Marinobacter nauticus TaxID=2743 RepID=A0A455WHZ6_MARNT|nr:hypothetical protein YBY_30070 [Marinobacter nauticus]